MCISVIVLLQSQPRHLGKNKTSAMESPARELRMRGSPTRRDAEESGCATDKARKRARKRGIDFDHVEDVEDCGRYFFYFCGIDPRGILMIYFLAIW